MGKMKSIMVLAVFSSGMVGADVNIDFVDIDSAGGGVDYSYRIGRTEVSFAQWSASPIGGGAQWTNAVGGVDVPVANITWHEAAQYCNWLTDQGGNSTMPYMVNGSGIVTNIMSRSAMLSAGGIFYVLPTVEEWYKAAYYTGSGFSLYANGSNSTPPDEGVPTGALYDGANVAPWAVGTGGTEQNGTLNMMGNIWEWLESTKDGEDYDHTASAQLMAFYGGDFSSGENTLGSSSGPFGDNRGREIDIGIRVVAVPEPGTISLMSLSTISLFLTRSMRRRKLAGRSVLPIGREHLCDTYFTIEEWEAANSETDSPDALAIAIQLIQAKAGDVLTRVHAFYKVQDEKFWNHMVASYEHRTARRKAFRAALKKKALRGFDAFLALIMR